MQDPILLVTKNTKSHPLETLQIALFGRVVQALNLRAALSALSREPFSMLIVDLPSQSNPEVLGEAAGPIPILEVDLASISTMELARQVTSTWKRFARERDRARKEAVALLKGELRNSLSSLLLESQLALREAEPSKQPKLANVVQLATRLCDHLRLEKAE